LTFNGLQGVLSQKIVLFIITAVRTSNPAYLKFGHGHFIPYPSSFDVPSFDATSPELLSESIYVPGWKRFSDKLAV
jgi:hypothetical protein